MKNLAPHIYRQRMIVEGIYGLDFEPECLLLKMYLGKLSELLGMTIIYGPLAMRQAEKIDPKHTGFEAVMIWAESGVNLYTWEDGRFFSVDLYSCKPFSPKTVISFTRDYFKATQLTHKNV